MRDHAAAQVQRIGALRQHRPCVQEFRVLRVVIKPDRRLHLAGAHAEPARKPIVAVGPIQFRTEVVQLADLARVGLCAHSEFVVDGHGKVQRSVGKGGAAIGRVHGQEVVVVRVRKPLRCESVNLYRAVEDLELLRVEAHRNCETREQCSGNASEKRWLHCGSPPVVFRQRLARSAQSPAALGTKRAAFSAAFHMSRLLDGIPSGLSSPRDIGGTTPLFRRGSGPSRQPREGVYERSTQSLS